MKKYGILLVLMLSGLFPVYGQFTEFHPELNWLTISGKHVKVHYHEGTERTAAVVLKIADEVWVPITTLYEYEPETVHYIIKDIDDYSNGATYFFDNRIEIWTSALDFELRGDHNWLRNVISHEFTHMVQIQSAIKTSRTFPALYLQWLNYEEERRPDILYGFPNIIASYPISSVNVPAWFAEGSAQYMRREFDYDNWDAHRDMILRSYALADSMLTWNQMGVFEKTSLGNESVYNSGFALCRYIAQKYGEDKLRKMSKALGRMKNFTMDAAIQDAIGKSGRELYDEWAAFLKEDYKKRTASVIKNGVSGSTLVTEGYGNFFPRFSPDGKYVYYLSNRGRDYLGQTSLYSFNPATKENKLVAEGVRSNFSFRQGTETILYAKLSEDNPNSYNVHDLYLYDPKTGDEKRITYGLRANQPNFSADGTKITFIYQFDGTTNLAVIDADGKNFRKLTSYIEGEQVFNPVFSADGNTIYFDFSYHHGRDILAVNTDGSKQIQVVATPGDERNPFVSADGFLYYSSDRTGIFNIYKRTIATGAEEQLTNVTGGAFMPALSPEGNLVYSLYTAQGYKIALLNKTDMRNIASGDTYKKLSNPPLDVVNPNGDFNDSLRTASFRNFADKGTRPVNPVPYSGAFSKITLFPVLRFDNYNTTNKFSEKIKPGLYFTSSDMLNRYSIFGGLSTNSRWERDLFFQFEYKNKFPGLYQLGITPEFTLELFNVSRKTNVGINIDEYPEVKTDVTYDLFEVAINARHRVLMRGSDVEFRYAYNKYTATIGSFIFPGTADLYPSLSDPYLLSSNFQIKYTFENDKRYIDGDINPVGAHFELKYNYELNRFNPDGEYTVTDGILVPQYKRFDFHRIESEIDFSFSLGTAQSLGLKLRGGTITGGNVPDFFDFYLGGLIGMKAYPFYSISGNEYTHFSATWRFPVLRNIDYKLGHLYLDKIFASVAADIGSAWNGTDVRLKGFRKGISAELRFSFVSYYLFPTAVFFNASYGLDSFDKKTRDKIVTYGKELRLYGGVLFDFSF